MTTSYQVGQLKPTTQYQRTQLQVTDEPKLVNGVCPQVWKNFPELDEQQNETTVMTQWSLLEATCTVIRCWDYVGTNSG